MRRATGMDEMFPWGETPRSHVHGCDLVILDPSTLPIEDADFDAANHFDRLPAS